MVEAASGSQTAVPGGATTTDSMLGSPTASPHGQTARTQGEHGPNASQAGLNSTSTDQHTEPGGLTGATNIPTVAKCGPPVSLGDPTVGSCKTDASSSVDGTSSPTTMEEDTDDDLLDYKPSPACNDMEINVVYLPSIDYSFLEEEEVTQLALGSQDAIFKKPAELEDHLKPLYISGHPDGTLVAHMLVDRGTMVNMMPYAQKTDVELLKMNMTLMGIGGEGPIGHLGIASMELTVGSKMIPTAFFIMEVQGNYNTILGHDWIHANHCVPST
jgi:hypothetical protein